MIHFLSEAPAKDLRGVALLRLDFNAEDNWRMEAAVPTVKLILKNARSVVILSHRGRPEGFEKKLSLRRDAEKLGRLMKRKVEFLSAFDFTAIKKKLISAPKGSIFVLENLRFLPGEEKNDAKFAKSLASLGDFYVNDAFAVSHRAHASVSAITRFLPSYAGPGLASEIIVLCKVMNAPKKPLVVILGGGKAYDKLGVMRSLRRETNAFLIGGAPANTLAYLTGLKVGKSLMEKDPKHLSELRKILDFKNIILPIDFRKSDGEIFDIGKETAEMYAEKVAKARTIIWAGPLGYFEDPRFAKGSIAVARAILANRKAFSVVGGGETVSFLRKYKLTKAFDFVSTGGGAMLEFLAGKKLPGIKTLEKNDKKI